ncbi:hypothetical protein PPL_04106 [Heterostelium album PN500]|uniref:Uncharacterized protein n=1 Tax=Heterostelium pallidum (strain ATCC 26659 / Pp 5 / PN500) TaxID=670386 RepID=D3B618_HETP5|nr:hypothetical protein PPL_04106 [Heterostelium album PN500]EFA83316.1 hypothetical protein PPL_04106 [Heterostelium album PN500]|eukprot:XP_020435433.1 hypothetical protein PPL_04106 [Heterostelium album PN500]
MTILISPKELNFKNKQSNNRLSFTVSNDSCKLIDMILCMDPDINNYIEIPDVRGVYGKKCCSEPHIPLNPQEHRLFYITYTPKKNLENKQLQGSLYLKYKIHGDSNEHVIPISIEGNYIFYYRS